MGDNIPRRQHYIPVMLLKNFCDPKGRLWVARDRRVFQSKPEDVFAERNLYATYDLSDVPSGQDYEEAFNSRKRGYEKERILSGIESDAAPAVEQIINQARRGEWPRLTPALRSAWKKFVVASIRRTPESQERESSEKKISDSLYAGARSLAAKDNRTLPDKALLAQSPTISRIVDMAVQNTYATYSAGDAPDLRKDEEDFSRQMGLLVAVTQIPNSAFVIGSRGIAVVEPDHDRDPVQGTWIPIAHDVAVQPTGIPGKDIFVPLNAANEGARAVARINKASAQSRMIAGRSKALVRSLMQTGQRRR